MTIIPLDSRDGKAAELLSDRFLGALMEYSSDFHQLLQQATSNQAAVSSPFSRKFSLFIHLSPHKQKLGYCNASTICANTNLNRTNCTIFLADITGKKLGISSEPQGLTLYNKLSHIITNFSPKSNPVILHGIITDAVFILCMAASQLAVYSQLSDFVAL